MANFSDLVNTNLNKDVVTIQGKEFPIFFDFHAVNLIPKFYGKPYKVFEMDVNKMMKNKRVTLGQNETRLLYALICAMINSGGNKATIDEVRGALSFENLVEITPVVLELFQRQTTQKKDIDRLKTDSKKK